MTPAVPKRASTWTRNIFGAENRSAIEQFSAARTLIGDNAITDFEMGAAYLALNRTLDAEKFARLAIARGPRNAKIELLLGRALAFRPESWADVFTVRMCGLLFWSGVREDLPLGSRNEGD